MLLGVFDDDGEDQGFRAFGGAIDQAADVDQEPIQRLFVVVGSRVHVAVRSVEETGVGVAQAVGASRPEPDHRPDDATQAIRTAFVQVDLVSGSRSSLADAAADAVEEQSRRRDGEVDEDPPSGNAEARAIIVQNAVFHSQLFRSQLATADFVHDRRDASFRRQTPSGIHLFVADLEVRIRNLAHEAEQTHFHLRRPSVAIRVRVDRAVSHVAAVLEIQIAHRRQDRDHDEDR